MTDAKTYVDSRWGTRNRDERKRLMSAYEAGQKQEGKMSKDTVSVEQWRRTAIERNEAQMEVARLQTALRQAGARFVVSEDDGGASAVFRALEASEARVAEAVSPSEEVEGLKPFSNERPSAVASDGETAEVCDADASHRHVDAEGNYIWHRHSHQEPSKADPLGVKGFDEYNHHDPAEHSGVERVDAHGWIGEPYAGAPKPVEPSPVEPLEGEWRRVEHQYWRDDPTGWERMTEGYTSYGTEVVWTHPKSGSQVVSLGIERAIAAHFAMEQYDLLKARAERAEERASTAERRLEGHENLAAAAIRERDEARGEVERLQVALEGAARAIHLQPASVHHRGSFEDCERATCSRFRAILGWEARVSTPVREERGE